MLNNYILIGKVRKIEKIGNKEVKLLISVNRTFKNDSGVYESDIFPLVIKNKNMVDTCINYIRIGDTIGVRGRIASEFTSDDNITFDENQKNNIYLVVEKITFLSSNKNIINNEKKRCK